MKPRASTPKPEFDPVWEDIYHRGDHANRYPWDAVVSFINRYRPLDRPVSETKVLEIGCGTASNLWFAAREGFRVAGIDASETAIAKAQERFRVDGLQGDLRIGNFNTLPFTDGNFDLAIDRAALTCVGYSVARRAVTEVARVMRSGGRFFSNLYSDRHTSAKSGTREGDGLTRDITEGSLVGVGQVAFYGRENIVALFPGSMWSIVMLDHVLVERDNDSSVHAEWRLVALKT